MPSLIERHSAGVGVAWTPQKPNLVIAGPVALEPVCDLPSESVQAEGGNTDSNDLFGEGEELPRDLLHVDDERGE